MSRKLEVLLRENLKDLGKCGDVVRVAPGYARNFLIPRRLATEANEENKRLMARRRIRLDAEEVKRNAEIDARVAKLAGAIVSTSGKADEGGHLFGSVSAANIAELLHKAGHGAVTEKDVRIDAPLKTVGAHAVKLHVFGDRYADVQVVITAEPSA
ncbi:MAG: 50S ribosomal protein L9 [Planctomycetes bacterium]|nr:50S ribosomal protein L9 [Planctomycetota bacterium]